MTSLSTLDVISVELRSAEAEIEPTAIEQMANYFMAVYFTHKRIIPFASYAGIRISDVQTTVSSHRQSSTLATLAYQCCSFKLWGQLPDFSRFQLSL